MFKSIFGSKHIPLEEEIYRASKGGKPTELKNFLRRALNEVGENNYLEWMDSEGRTPLVIAAQKNNFECVRLLLQHKANVQHCSHRREGGTALHEAVVHNCSRQIVELLLNNGASPFVENICGITALDYAINKIDPALVRRMERLSVFASYLRVKVPRFVGFSKTWVVKWISVVPRNICPLKPQSEQIIRRNILCYHDATYSEPFCKIFIDGSLAQICTDDSTGEKHCLVTLHPTHMHPRGLYCSGDNTRGYTLHFKSQAGLPSNVLEDFCKVIGHMPRVNRETSSIASVRPSMTDEEFARQLHASLNAGMPPPLEVQLSQNLLPEVLASASSLITAESTPVMGIQNDYSITDDMHVTTPTAPPIPPEFIVEPELQCDSEVENESQSELTQREVYKAVEEEEDDSKLCVVCLSRPRTAGFVHNGSVHQCVCQECADSIMNSNAYGVKKCPICRRDIESVITKFF